jgi:hypothetical protein
VSVGRAKGRRQRKSRNKITVRCNCACPNWGIRHDDVWEVKCDCGTSIIACGLCVVEGRIQDCGCGLSKVDPQAVPS